MTKREVEMGAAAPLLQSGGTAAPAHWSESGNAGGSAAPFSMPIRFSDAAKANGDYLMAEVRKAVARVAKKGVVNRPAVRELRRLVMELWSIVRQVPEFIEYMDWLAGKDLAAVDHILEVAPRIGERSRTSGRGRRHETFDYLVTMVDLVMKQEGGSAAKACKRLLEEIRPSPFSRFSTVAAMQTAYSLHRDRVHAKREISILAEDIARVPYVLRADR